MRNKTFQEHLISLFRFLHTGILHGKDGIRHSRAILLVNLIFIITQILTYQFRVCT